MKHVMTVAGLSALLFVAGCDVEQKEEGEMPDVDVEGDPGQLPAYDVDVEQTREGRMPGVDVDVEGGNMPEYEVEGPDVEVGTEEKTVTVPDVDVGTQEETVTVPDVDIEMPDEEEDDEAKEEMRR